jgi:hypothetical protein
VQVCCASDTILLNSGDLGIPMSFEQEIKRLCGQIVTCESDQKATELTHRMQELLHARMDELRLKTQELPPAPPKAA